MEKYLCNNIFDSNNFYSDRYIYHSRWVSSTLE